MKEQKTTKLKITSAELKSALTLPDEIKKAKEALTKLQNELKESARVISEKARQMVGDIAYSYREKCIPLIYTTDKADTETLRMFDTDIVQGRIPFATFLGAIIEILEEEEPQETKVKQKIEKTIIENKISPQTPVNKTTKLQQLPPKLPKPETDEEELEETNEKELETEQLEENEEAEEEEIEESEETSEEETNKIGEESEGEFEEEADEETNEKSDEETNEEDEESESDEITEDDEGTKEMPDVASSPFEEEEGEEEEPPVPIKTKKSNVIKK